MGLWSRFTAWLSGWPESAEAKHGRSNHEEDLLFAEAEMKAKNMTKKEIYAAYAEGTSMKTLIDSSDIANMAVFLSSKNSRFVSGQIIAVDGHTEVPDPKF